MSSRLRHPKRWLALTIPMAGLATVLFYAVVFTEPVRQSWVFRYTAGHPIEIAIVALFFWGMADLLARRLRWGGEDAETTTLVYRFKQLPTFIHDQHTVAVAPLADRSESDRQTLFAGAEPASLIGERLLAGLEFIKQRGTSLGLDQHLRYLADLGAFDGANEFRWVKVIAWMIPILGFLGTVVGITDAIANLTPAQLETSLSTVTNGLGVAFDTTALSLALSLVLMGFLYPIERKVGQVLSRLDRESELALTNRYQIEQAPTAALPAAHPAHLEMLVERVGTSLQTEAEKLISAQAEVWSKSMVATLNAQAIVIEQWRRDTQQLFQSLLSKVHDGAQVNQKHAESIASLHHEMTRVADSFEKAMKETGQLKRLQEVLSHNLTAINQNNRIDQTLHLMTAAVHVMTAKSNEAQSAANEASSSEQAKAA